MDVIYVMVTSNLLLLLQFLVVSAVVLLINWSAIEMAWRGTKCEGWVEGGKGGGLLSLPPFSLSVILGSELVWRATSMYSFITDSTTSLSLCALVELFFPTKNSRIYYLVDASCLCVWCLIDFQCQWWWWPRNATTTTTTMTTKKIIIGDWEEWEIERWTWTSECFYPSISHSRLLSGVFGDFNFFTVTRWPAFPLAIALPVTRCLSNVPFVSHIQYFFVCLCRMVVVVVVVYRHSANTLTNQINVFNWEKRDNKSLFTNVMIKERE